jgi:arabinogalactan endo-1,4-beta-galactosidase
MNENTTTTLPVREEIESDIIDQVRNEIEDALLQNAPNSWSDERCEAVEEHVLDHTRLVLAALSTKEIQSAGALQAHIVQAIAETKRIIRMGGV